MSQGDKERLALLSQQGYQYLRENMLDAARERFQEILSIEPTNNYALVGLGDLERKTRRYDRAVTHYEECLRHHPDNNYALFGLAESLRSMRKYNRAIEVWEQYLKHEDQNVTVLTRVADAHRKARNFRRSKELYERVLELEPDNPYALIGLGHLHYDFREFQAAMGYWKRMHELRGDAVDIRVLTSLGNCHRKLKSYREGIPYFEMALAKEPRNFYALYGLADCYRGLREPERSLEYWDQILALDQQNKVILTRAGDAYRTLGDLDTAETYYARALNQQYDTYAILGLAMVHRKRGDVDKAISALENLANSEPENPRVFLELADCYEGLGKISEALAVLARHANAVRSVNDSVQRKISELRRRM